MTQNAMQPADMFKMEPSLLIDHLAETFYTPIPEEIVSTEDMEEAAKTLLKLTSNYSYLCELVSRAKVETRIAKRNLSKEEYEDMVDRKEIIQNMTDIIKQKYAAVSRAITIRLDNNAELRMVHH